MLKAAIHIGLHIGLAAGTARVAATVAAAAHCPPHKLGLAKDCIEAESSIPALCLLHLLHRYISRRTGLGMDTGHVVVGRLVPDFKAHNGAFGQVRDGSRHLVAGQDRIQVEHIHSDNETADMDTHGLGTDGRHDSATCSLLLQRQWQIITGFWHV